MLELGFFLLLKDKTDIKIQILKDSTEFYLFIYFIDIDVFYCLMQTFHI